MSTPVNTRGHSRQERCPMALVAGSVRDASAITDSAHVRSADTA